MLKDKLGITGAYLEQLATFSGPARDPRGWSVAIAYCALLPWEQVPQRAGARAVERRIGTARQRRDLAEGIPRRLVPSPFPSKSQPLPRTRFPPCPQPAFPLRPFFNAKNPRSHTAPGVLILSFIMQASKY